MSGPGGVGIYVEPHTNNVGIGITNPTEKLHIVGDTRLEGNLIVNGTQTIINTDVNTTEQLVVTNDGTGPALIVTQKGANSIAEFYDGDGGILALKIANNGLVGIGTSEPSVALDVVGTVKASSFIGNGSQLTGIIASKWSNTSSNLYVLGSNVGIGTATPRTQLEVAGHIWPSSNVAYDLGSTNLRFRDLYLSGNTIDLGGTRLSRNEETGGLSVVNPLTNALADTNVGNLVVASNVNIGGNVGVGTTNPQAKLHITGNAKLDGTLVATGSITGSSFVGNASTASILATPRLINGTSFDGSSNITLTANTPSTLTRGNYLTGSNFDGSVGSTWAVDATDANVTSKVVARDALGNFNAGSIRLTNGTLASPSFSWTTASNTGLYLPGTDQVGLVTGGIERMRVVANGNVGIGTTNPQNAFHVQGIAQATTFSGSGASLTSLPATSLTGVVSVANGGTGVATLTASKVLVGNGTSNILQSTNLHWDNSNSRLGVGTANPRAKLDVNDTGAMIIPVGTDAQLPATPVLGMIRYNSTTNRLQFYSNSGWNLIGGIIATGGVISEIIGYRVHTFTSSGTFTVQSGGEVEYLVVAGGGPGGAGNTNEGGGGGGAGGYLSGYISIFSQSYAVNVGTGGPGSTDSTVNSTNGLNSSAFGLVSIGGGSGGSCSASSGNSGGSGGGGGGCGTAKLGGSGTAGQGYGGGMGQWTGGPHPNPGINGNGGGGGGAGGVGQSGADRAPFNGTTTGTIGGAGAGILSSITGTNVTYAVGGDGGAGRSTHAGANGTNYSGNGGGGSSGNQLSGNGGSGIVIIRYRN